MYLLGYDIGSSSIKASLVDASTGKPLGTVRSPEQELPISSSRQGWAEQDPEEWWKHVCLATKKLLELTQINKVDIKAIGIAYQMHGLVVVDRDGEVLRPAIIWCDSRAVEIGNKAFVEIGTENCLSELLNSPGNFTASKLKWLKENEPEIYKKADKILLPGDYIALKMTGTATTTVSGLSEGTFWDFKNNSVSQHLINYYGFDVSLIPNIVPTYGNQGELMAKAASELGLCAGTTIGYRAGDQPNNALALNVLKPGEIAATGGTSGVVYAVVDQLIFDTQSRINGFAHVNHSKEKPRIGLLQCINGSGILYSWLNRELFGGSIRYPEMEKLAARVPVGSDELCILPFGNGAERILGNKNPGASILNLHFNIHDRSHLIRAALEGIVFSFTYGIEIMRNLGIKPKVMRVGNDNLFQSDVFSQSMSSLLGTRIEVLDSTGAIGAAKAAGAGSGIYSSLDEALGHIPVEKIYEPGKEQEKLVLSYQRWKDYLLKSI